MALIDDRCIDEAPLRMSEATPGDYIALLKPRVMSLVVFTAVVGLVAAPGTMNPLLALIAILAIAIGAGASGALNMWYDADIDKVMSRTAKRPVPAGRVTPGEALGFGLVLSVLSVMTLGVLVNWLSASLLAFTIFFYAVIYTMWLKRWTPQNIVIGGAAGSFPPMIGWAAATGNISLESVILFLIIFLWTPPHFWALALYRVEDYRQSGLPMLPVTHGSEYTRLQILLYTLILRLCLCTVAQLLGPAVAQDFPLLADPPEPAVPGTAGGPLPLAGLRACTPQWQTGLLGPVCFCAGRIT
jgi:protoheme IX farnesyltransferase